MDLLCIPYCKVPIPQIGKAEVSTTFDLCKSPPHLEIKIKTPTRDSPVCSSFTAGNHQETRQIGGDDWPLELNVQFKEQPLWNNRKNYYAKAYIRVPHTGDTAYFMNGSVEVPPAGYCRYHNSSSSAQILLLCTLLTLFFVGTSIAVSMLIHCIYARQLNIKTRSRKGKIFAKKNTESSSVQILAPYPYAKIQRAIEDDRLPVIMETEEDEIDGTSDFGLSEAASDSEPFKKSICAQIATSVPHLAMNYVTVSQLAPPASQSAYELGAAKWDPDPATSHPVEV